MIPLLTFIAKTVSFFSKLTNLGAGGTWPGEIALRLDKNIFQKLAGQIPEGVILIAGTNGKTTTAKMIKTILRNGNGRSGLNVAYNESGANLLNGLASALLSKTNLNGKVCADIGVFEVDEATLPLVLSKITPRIIILLNLFRDQLDRYGEVDILANKWLEALQNLKHDLKFKTTLIINADDPQLAFIGKQLLIPPPRWELKYFGLGDKKYFLSEKEHAADSVYCLRCGNKLEFKGVYFSHLGQWSCKNCGLKQPALNIKAKDVDSPLAGIYNIYNTLAATLIGQTIGIYDDSIKMALKRFSPAFGRLESFEINGKKVTILLSKNPAGFNASLTTVLDQLTVHPRGVHSATSGEDYQKPKTLLLVLNDRIPDGRDVSWIWDVDFEIIPENQTVFVSGGRAHDLALRIKYSRGQNSNVKSQNQMSNLKILENLEVAIQEGLNNTKKHETFWILATYSAMLDVRKILTGKNIL